MMAGNILHWGTQRFPDAESVMRVTGNAVRRIAVPRMPRSAIVAAGFGGALVIFGGVGYVGYVRHAADVHAATSRVEAANIDLQDELAKLRDQVAASKRDLTMAQARVASLSDELHTRPQPQAQLQQPAASAVAEEPAGSKSDKVAQLNKSLYLAEAQRATMAARLSKAEADLAEEQARQAQIQAMLEQLQKQVQQLSADRDKTISERDRLRARVGELEQKLSMAAQGTRPQAAAGPAPAPARPQAQTETPPPQQQRMALVVVPGADGAVEMPQHGAPTTTAPRVANGALNEFERVLASAGVDVRHLFSEFGVNRGEGGPFVPAPRGAQPALTPEKLAALRTMMKALPVSAPLESYDVSSPFGVRGDPENGHAAFHTGLDMTAPYMSPVYATAPGVVTYAGYRDDYGKIVEIDHGNGIATRYAHLHSFTVSVGQRVAAHSQIGYLGSTGRATGPHVHYEVVVNGEPQDPEKFLGLARFVPAIMPASVRN
jgi:murein DD-endopeptidase MepM/ murein hydrolase activator NlpD